MGILASLFGRPMRSKVRRIVPSYHGNTVKLDTTPLSRQRGWVQKNNRYSGYYVTKYGTWFGGIEQRGDRFRVYIENPPMTELRRHSRWPCFHRMQHDWWEISLHTGPKDGDVNAIIRYVERLIHESFTQCGHG